MLIVGANQEIDDLFMIAATQDYEGINCYGWL